MVSLSCPACGRDEGIELKSEDKTISVRNENIPFNMDFRRCNICGEEFVIPGLDSDPLDKAYRVYRTKHNLLQPEEIKEFRKRYNLTQGELTKLLGFGGATISRYENGKLQDETHDRLIRLAMECENLRNLVINSEGVFSDDKKESVLKTINDNTGQMVSCLQRFITINLEDEEPDEYRGFQKFNLAKFTEAVLYLCRGGTMKTKLNKLLFYSDFLHFKDYTLSITGAKYAHITFGPAPNNFDLYYPTLARQEAIDIEEIEFTDFSGDKYTSKREPDLSLFDDGELRILASVKEHFKDWSATRLSKRSHEEKGYKETENGDNISYLNAQYIEL